MADTPAGYWFKSPLFSVEPGEDQETNPGRYGRQLARWLAERLRARGQQVEDVTPEDWGWRVACRFAGDRFIVACGNLDDAAPDEAASTPRGEVIWHAFPASASPLWRRLLRRHDVALGLQRFDVELRAILAAEPRITLTDEP